MFFTTKVDVGIAVFHVRKLRLSGAAELGREVPNQDWGPAKVRRPGDEDSWGCPGGKGMERHSRQEKQKQK